MYRRTLLATISASIGLIAGCSSDLDTSPTNDNNDSDDGGSSGSSSNLIRKDERELVISVQQLGSGWTRGSDYNETSREVSFFDSSSNLIDSRATVYDSVEEAKQAFDDYVNAIEDEGRGYDQASVGDEAIVYRSPFTTCFFRERNATGEVTFQEKPESRVIELARLQLENY